MRAIYRGVDLCATETIAFDCESVYDDAGMAYLYTKVTLVMQSIVNGQTAAVVTGTPPANGPVMSYKLQGQDTTLSAQPGRPGNPTGDPNYRPAPQAVQIVNQVAPGRGNIPPDTGMARQPQSRLRTITMEPNAPLLTHDAIRHRLSTPRGKLYVFSGAGMESGKPAVGGEGPPVEPAVLTLESPNPGLPCDCKNGPFPKILSINAAFGDANTLLVTWAVETYINEGPENDVNPWGALLSNSFSQTHNISEDGFTTISTAGSAIFRTDFLQGNKGSPDSNRPFFVIPIMQGFVRENIQVTGRADVTGVDYSFQDRQVKVNFVAAPYSSAAKISAVHRQMISSMSLIDSALSTYQAVLGLKADRNFARDEVPGGDDKKAMRRFARMIGGAIARSLRRAPGGLPSARGGGGGP